MLIVLATLVFGASGSIASGAFTTSSQGSLSDAWVQVIGTNLAVNPSLQQGEANGGSDGAGGDETGSEGTTDTAGDDTDDNEAAETEDEAGGEDSGTDGDDPTGTIRVQVVTEPGNTGNAVNGAGSATWNGTIVPSSVVRGTSDGFFRGLNATNVNKNAVSTVGRLQDGSPNGEVAFIIANVGPEEQGGPTGSATVTATLFDDDGVLETNQLRFPYRVVDIGGATVARGANLCSADGVRLADGHVIEVVIVADTTDGDDDLNRIDQLQFSATGVGS